MENGDNSYTIGLENRSKYGFKLCINLEGVDVIDNAYKVELDYDIEFSYVYSKKIIEEVEAEAEIIGALIQQRAALGLSQRDLAALCDIPQSSVARIESNKITPRLDTILKLLNEMGLTLRVTKLSANK